MWTSASLLSVFVLPAYVVLLPEIRFLCMDFLGLLIDIGWVGTLILLPICDVMLLVDVFKGRQALLRIA
jgi:hypothetical protein